LSGYFWLKFHYEYTTHLPLDARIKPASRPALMIRLNDIQDGEFSSNPTCQEWLRQFLDLLSSSFGVNPNVRFGSYRHAGAANLTLDIYSSDTSTACVAITITLLDEKILLPPPSLHQMDICLPGLVDAFYLAQTIAPNGLVSLNP
jgi:hypothetical protein